jgi:hypothetical protein
MQQWNPHQWDGVNGGHHHQKSWTQEGYCSNEIHQWDGVNGGTVTLPSPKTKTLKSACFNKQLIHLIKMMCCQAKLLQLHICLAACVT